MKTFIISLLSLGLGMGLAQAQSMDGSGFGGNGPGPGGDGSNVTVQLPEEITLLRDELDLLRASLKESRDTLVAQLEAAGATLEEKMVALADWRVAHESDITAIQDLADQLRLLMEDYRPGVIDVPEYIQEKRDAMRTLRQQLAESRAAAIAAVEDPTEENVRAALEQWRIANEGTFTQIRTLAQEVRQWFRDNRPHRQGPVVTAEMTQRRQQFQANIQEASQIRQRLRDGDCTEEEREQLRLRERELIRDRKEIMRQRRAAEGGESGERRPGG